MIEMHNIYPWETFYIINRKPIVYMMNEGKGFIRFFRIISAAWTNMTKLNETFGYLHMIFSHILGKLP